MGRNLKATKLYEYADVTDLDRGDAVFVSEYYLENKRRDDEVDIVKYRIELPEEIVVYHTILKYGHTLKNIIRFVHEHEEHQDESV